ncbi:GTP-binding protein [Prolixibacteraceae bacterium JC049]|nr:GTP-binding protein [Prolixibacteraceae bacterium JC049]
MKQIPVTIITGFLGAGKTTLLNQIIKKHTAKKFVIFENEFGSENIDSELIYKTEGGNIYELSNGCICCSITNEFGLMINSLLLSNKQFNHLLIETTGIADPASIQEFFVSGERIRSKFYVDSTIALIDGENFFDLLTDRSEVRQQLVLADQVIVNKMDRIDDLKKEQLDQKLRLLNPTARIYYTQFAQLNGINLLDNHFNTAEKVEQLTYNHFKTVQLVNDEKASKHEAITTCTISFKGDFEEERFRFWMDYFLKFNSSNLYRMKGIICIKNEPQKMIFQSVKGYFTLEEGNYWNDTPRENKIVLIGKNINKEEIEKSLKQILVTETE